MTTLYLARPLPDGTGYITQWFGQRPEVYARFGLKGHDGIDYGAPLGTPVLATHDGKAILKPFDAKGYGNYIILEMEGFYTLYAHLDTALITMSDACCGDQLGTVGNTGNSTGPHLHWALRATGDHRDYSGWKGWINPKPFRGATRVTRGLDGEQDAG